MSLINMKESSEFVETLDNLFENLNKFKQVAQNLAIPEVNLKRLEKLLTTLKTDGEYNNVLFNDYVMTFNILAVAFPGVKNVFKEYSMSNLKLAEKDNKDYLKSLFLGESKVSEKELTHDFYTRMIPALKKAVETKKITESKALVLALLTFNEEALKEKKLDFLHNSFLYVKNMNLANRANIWMFKLFNIDFVDYRHSETIKAPALSKTGFVFGFYMNQSHDFVRVDTNAKLVSLSNTQELDLSQVMEETRNEELKNVLNIYCSKYNLVKTINGEYVLIHRKSIVFEKEIKVSSDVYEKGYKSNFSHMMYKNLLKQENVIQAGSIVKYKEYLFFVMKMDSPVMSELNEKQVKMTVAMMKNDCEFFDQPMDGNNLVEKVLSFNKEDFSKISLATDFEKSLFLQFSGVK